MAVTLQYQTSDGQLRFIHQDDTQQAIQAAIVLARHKAKPLRILSKNGGVLVAERALQQQVELAQPKAAPTHVETLAEQLERAREAIDRARYERRMQAAEETIPGWGSFG